MDDMGGSAWAFERYKQEYNNSLAQAKVDKPIVNQVGGVRKVTKGRLGNVEFQVNPTTVSFGGGMNWSEVASPGRPVPLMQLGCGKANTFSFELYINEWMFDHKVNAGAFVSEIFKCRGSKQAVKFVWGNMVHDVVVVDCEITGQSFNPDLTFREVTMSVSLTTVYL